MKRIGSEPTKKMVLDALNYDTVGRHADLRAFLSLLDSIEGNYVFFIDGEWGDGKTYFVREVSLLLEQLNPNLTEKQIECVFGLGCPFNNLEELNFKYLPIYYNAWENDSDGDPVLSIIKSLVLGYAQHNLSNPSVLPARIQEKVTAVVDFLPHFGAFGSVNSLINVFNGEDILCDLKVKDKVKEKLESLLESLLENRGDKVVLFIDELDRCSPAFALNLLERVKFLFSKNNTIIVFSTNAHELAHTVEGFYGAGFNGAGYLSRFYDQKVSLSPVSQDRYLEQIGLAVSSSQYYFDQIVQFMSKQCRFTMRDCERYYQEIKGIREKVCNQDRYNLVNPGIRDFKRLVELGLLPILIAIRNSNNADYQLIISGDGEVALENRVRDCLPFQSLLNEYQRIDKGELTSALSEIYGLLFRNTSVDRYTNHVDEFKKILLAPLSEIRAW